MRLSDLPLLSAAEIRARVAELAEAISNDYADCDVTLVAVLKGAAVFAADLMRELKIEACLEFIRARSYAGTDSRGSVDITFRPEADLAGRHVIVIEDILDTGRTTSAVMECLRGAGPAGLKLCTLLDKPSRRVIDVRADYVGFTIDNHFVVGYGLDYDDKYRNLPAVYTLEDIP
jgi:hypoxanthine phosphoribosyltransferase